VERAAPGGEGNVIDHFSRDAIRRYLARFDRAFGGRRPDGLRAFFNDSYEVDDASGQSDATPTLFEEFRRHRGTTCDAICRRCSRTAATMKRAAASLPTIVRRSPTSCSRRSQPSGDAGPIREAPSSATRRTDRRPTSWICMPQAMFRKRKGPRSCVRAGLRRWPTSPAAGSSRRKPRPG
jgi:hypothetical protein